MKLKECLQAILRCMALLSGGCSERERLKEELVSVRSTWAEEIKIRDDMLRDANRQCCEQQDKIESLELEIRAAGRVLETYGHTEGLTHDRVVALGRELEEAREVDR